MKTVLVLLTLFFTTHSFAQNDDAAIKQTINTLFDGMRRSDTAMIRSAFAPQGILQTVLKSKDGKVFIQSEPLDSFIAFVGKPHKEVYDERITFDLIKVDGDLAIAWTPYKFYLDEKFSHCGVDSYQLVKLNGEWKIQYLIDTRRKQNCD
jgi:hypothetical protein